MFGCRWKPEKVSKHTAGCLTVLGKYGRKKEEERFGKEQEVSAAVFFVSFICFVSTVDTKNLNQPDMKPWFGERLVAASEKWLVILTVSYLFSSCV